eukprot:4438376-Karenia_brevis.AAC.1
MGMHQMPHCAQQHAQATVQNSRVHWNKPVHGTVDSPSISKYGHASFISLESFIASCTHLAFITCFILFVITVSYSFAVVTIITHEFPTQMWHNRASNQGGWGYGGGWGVVPIPSHPLGPNPLAKVAGIARVTGSVSTEFDREGGGSLADKSAGTGDREVGAPNIPCENNCNSEDPARESPDYHEEAYLSQGRQGKGAGSLGVADQK